MPRLGVDWAELQSCWEHIRDSGHFTEGYYVRAFEEEVQRWSNLHAVAYSSAGAGLFGMMRLAEGFGTCGAVAVPNNTFFATGAMVREAGRDVVLVDCRRDDFSMSADALRKTNREFDTVVVTHVGGHLAKDYAGIAGFCQSKGATYFEDAAHALGVGFAGACAGSYSDGAVFSMYPTKAVPAGEGGLVVTKHAWFSDALREFRNYGKRKGEDGVIRYGVGFNLRMDEWTAAVCYLQMRRLEEIVQRRNDAAEALMRVMPPLVQPGLPFVSNWYKYPVDAGLARDLGIRRYTGKIYQRSDQLAAALGIADQGPFPDSEWVADSHACLPLDEGLYDGMTTDQVMAWLRSEP